MNPQPRREPGQVVTAEYRRHGVLRYAAEDREIVGANQPWFNNRPLYGPANDEGVALAGDRPFVRLLGKRCVHGAFAAGIVRKGPGRWFHEWGEVVSRYRCGRMSWRMSDPAFPGAEAELTVVPLPRGAGFAARLYARGLEAGDRLVWTYGGAKAEDMPRNRWDPINRGNPQVCRIGEDVKAELTLGPVPEWSTNNAVSWAGGAVRVGNGESVSTGRSSRAGEASVGDASRLGSPAELAGSSADRLPIACEAIALRAGEDEVFWSFAAVEGGAAARLDPSLDFAEALAWVKSVERMRSDSPDGRLDAAVAAVCHAIDGNCERDPAIFRHGCMTWSVRLLGWRVIHGATVLGWHERVRENAAYYAAAQRREADGRFKPAASAEMRLCHEGEASRFYGKGRILKDQHMYDMQTQFFDQTIRDWRWTADPEMERILFPALELHLEWARECFDPDDDGLYESYINTLPTDSMWYNGGGGAEQSAYIAYGHLAAADMARRAGDEVGEARHRARAEKIRRALRGILWVKERGHYGAYVEQGGHRRVHADAWTYGQFLPIDAGLAEPEEALQALYFTEWGLERIPLPFGGAICQSTNWAPSKWSTRDLFSGDICALSLAYFRTGLPAEGWELLQGALLEGCFASSVPGGFSHIGAGTDFGDCAHVFARAVAEGLFGFEPDYPNGRVRVRPAFPPEWPRASLRTPDFALEFRREGARDCYRLELAREAGVEFRLLVRAEGIRRVTCDGKEVPWTVEAGFGCTFIVLKVERTVPRTLRAPPAPVYEGKRLGSQMISGSNELPIGKRPRDRPLHLFSIEVEVELETRVDDAPARHIEADAGDEVSLDCGEGVAVDLSAVRDFHGILESPALVVGGIRARLARKPGHHIVLMPVMVGELPQHRVFKLKVADPAAAAERAARTPLQAPAGAVWSCLDLSSVANGDVRTIFKQRYLSPRPETCSVRLGVDGYSAWTFAHWKEGPPEIDLRHVGQLSAGGRLRTPQGAEFAPLGAERNIAFTSLWDNWPRSVTVPVGLGAYAAWTMVCGSTFPMQTGIANAELRFRYVDGSVERLELVPPLNFWSLCPWGGLDYDYETDAFCLPATPPPAVQLGAHCRAMVLSWTLRPGVELADVTLEALSQDVVIGLMGVSLMNLSSVIS